MRKMLLELGPDVEVVADIPTVAGSVEWLRAHEVPDLAFLDVRLADGDSFEIFKHIDVGCPVIFTTAYDEYALKAFRVNALDYLLKPLKREELATALERFQTTRTVRDLADTALPGGTSSLSPSAPVKRFLIRFGDRFRVVEPKDIAYIHSQNKNTFVRTTAGRDLPLDESLDRLEKQLAPDSFFRLNRQLIVHFQSIKELLAYSKSRVKVVLDPSFAGEAIVSSERSGEFKRWLSG
jgi:two-component system LytT family response regulator